MSATHGLSRRLEFTEGSPPEMVESFLLRGPQGQVHAAADSAGLQQSGHGYTPWGANAYNWPPAVLPEYIDGDLRVLPQFYSSGAAPVADPPLPGWKDGAGVTADTLLPAPALDGQASGGNGQGASGSPDTPPGTASTQFIPGSPWDMSGAGRPGAGGGPGGDYAQGLERGGIRPPGTDRGGLPGLPSGKSPVGAPPLVQDSATIADQRLAGLWQRFGLSGSSEYYGVKPGQQRGASGWDDLRNPRLPLTAQRGAGSGSRLTGPPTAILPAFPENYLPHGNPQVPNPAAGGRQGGGTTDRGGWVWRGGKWVWDEEQGEFRAAGDSLDAPGSSGGGRSDPNSMQDAMDVQDWYRNWPGYAREGAIDDSDPGAPGTMGRAVWDAAVPYGGAGGWLYDRANGVTGGALDNYYGGMSPEQYNTAANVAIGVGILTNIAGGVLAGVSGLAGMIGRGIVAGVGMIANTARVASGAIPGLAQVGRGVWGLPNFPRGTLINTLFGSNLISNYPTIDRFVRGTATSIKSLNLNALSYRNLSTLNRVLTKYTDSVAGFNGRPWGQDVVNAGDVKGRVLELAVPAGTGAQQSIINNIISYGKSIGVSVEVVIIP